MTYHPGNTHGAVCTRCGLVGWAESYAQATAKAEQHQTLRNCDAHIRITSTR